jgi:hypothetical protein
VDGHAHEDADEEAEDEGAYGGLEQTVPHGALAVLPPVPLSLLLTPTTTTRVVVLEQCTMINA